MNKEALKNLAISTLGAAVVIGGLYTFDFNGDPMTYEEWQSYVKMIDYEVDQAGGSLTIESKGGDYLDALHDQILDRKVDEKVVIDGAELTTDEYEALRAGLIEKVTK